MGSSLFALNVITHIESDPSKYRVNSEKPQIEQTSLEQSPEVFTEVAKYVNGFWQELRSNGAVTVVNSHLRPYFKAKGIIPTIFVGNLLTLTEKMRSMSNPAPAAVSSQSYPFPNDYMALVFLLTGELAYQILHQRYPKPVKLETFREALDPDVTLLLGAKKVPLKAHRSVLEKSPGFKRLLDGRKDANAVTIFNRNLDPLLTEAFVTILYTNSLPNVIGKVHDLTDEQLQRFIRLELGQLRKLETLEYAPVKKACQKKTDLLMAAHTLSFGRVFFTGKKIQDCRVDLASIHHAGDGKLCLNGKSFEVNLTWLKLHSPFFRKLIEASSTKEILLPKDGLPLQFYQKWVEEIYQRVPADTTKMNLDYSFYLQEHALPLLRIAKIEGDKVLNRRCCQQLIADRKSIGPEDVLLIDHFELSAGHFKDEQALTDVFEYGAKLPAIRTLRAKKPDLVSSPRIDKALVQLLKAKGQGLVSVDVTVEDGDEILNVIAEHCPQITTLKFKTSHSCDPFKIKNVLVRCPQLRYLAVDGPLKMTSEDLSLPQTRLQYLKFGPKVDEKFMIACVKHTSDLRSLDVPNLTEDLGYALLHVGSQFERIRLREAHNLLAPNFSPKHYSMSLSEFHWLSTHLDPKTPLIAVPPTAAPNLPAAVDPMLM